MAPVIRFVDTRFSRAFTLVSVSIYGRLPALHPVEQLSSCAHAKAWKNGAPPA